MAAIRISGDLERVGDLAKNIAKRTTKIAAEARLPRAFVGLKSMYDAAAMQLEGVIDAYAQRDVQRAREVWSRDAELDAVDDSVFRDLLTFMMEDPRNISFCTHLLFCSKNIERIGDHTTNNAETVVFLVTANPCRSSARRARPLSSRRNPYEGAMKEARATQRSSTNTAPRVLVVEDEAALSLLLSYNLEAEGFIVERVERGDEAE